jgi:hypothetical protein
VSAQGSPQNFLKWKAACENKRAIPCENGRYEPEFHVSGDAELAAPLHVEGNQVHAVLGADLLEEMIGDLGSVGRSGL